MRLRPCLQACSPHIHPSRWLAINATILLWSVVLLILIYVKRDEAGKTSVEFEYLIYNFMTCIVWVIEVFFNVLDHRDYFATPGSLSGGETSLLQPQPKGRSDQTAQKSSISIWIQVIFATYFFVDSAVVAVHLSRDQIHRQAQGMTIDICLNLLAYGFMVYRQLADMKTNNVVG